MWHYCICAYADFIIVINVIIQCHQSLQCHLCTLTLGWYEHICACLHGVSHSQYTAHISAHFVSWRSQDIGLSAETLSTPNISPAKYFFISVEIFLPEQDLIN